MKCDHAADDVGRGGVYLRQIMRDEKGKAGVRGDLGQRERFQIVLKKLDDYEGAAKPFADLPVSRSPFFTHAW